MGIEIERKYLVSSDEWKYAYREKVSIQQGYLLEDSMSSLRVRVQDDIGLITYKHKMRGITRQEYEYEIPLNEARELMENCKSVITKDRYLVDHDNHTWEVDEFHGFNSDLVIAEIELGSEEEVFEIPEWIGEDVTTDKRYYNIYLVSHPYSTWKEELREAQ